VVFVLEDWKLLASLAGPDERARIARRMQMLEELIQPCSFD
jgi:Trp operon repressor